MIFTFSPTTPLQNFKILSQCLVPRPIAWISTINDNGSINLAPFSFFAPVSLEPTILSVCLMKKSDGGIKDTLYNAKRSKHASITIPNPQDCTQVQQCSTEFERGKSEASEIGIRLTSILSDYPPVPSNCQCAFFCDFYDIWEFQSTTDTLLLEVKQCFVDARFASESSENLRFVLEPLVRAGSGFKVLQDL
ncbi:flavin reductase family protein [uncultured Helicobacter sp.]|uniref:flavin reductase family protein n=1 Tax=uncultured Helicobacter sp. TaxID=175537 RepID=UPI001C3AF00E|nr:flavin reductase [Candidatus Helicobacter avicola]